MKSKFKLLPQWRNCFLLFMISIVLQSCEREVDYPFKETRFEVSEFLMFEIPSVLGINLPWQIPFLETPIPFSTSAGTTNPHIDLVRDIKLQDLRLEIIYPVNQSFSFLESIEIYISTDLLPEIRLAHHYHVDDDIGSVMHLVGEGDVLDDYMKGGTFDMRVELVADELIFSNLEIEGELVLDVELVNEP